MVELYEELLQLANRSDEVAERGTQATTEPLEALKNAADEVGRAFGGSWSGYHANVYYEGLHPPPPGAHFSQEWGLMEVLSSRLGSHGDWREYGTKEVKAAIFELAGNPDLSAAREFENQASEEFEDIKESLLSILETILNDSKDVFLQRLRDEASELTLLSAREVEERLRPKGQVVTRDTVVIGQGSRVPPHISVLSEVIAIQHTIGTLRQLGQRARRAGSHLARQGFRKRKAETVGTNVFIGHGRSLVWRELKDFLEDRLRLPVDEFNRVPIAGVTNIARLSEMLDAASIAFLVMTAEDEQPSGKMRARMNVVHEAGLFQGRLGFTRAIVVLEDGCEEFSNIEGLGQIRFPKGNIKAAFEEIRQVLEREGLVGI